MEVYDFSIACRHIDDETSRTPCKIEGVLPTWLNGFIIYNGPGKQKIGKVEYKYAFDGCSLMQKISIKNGSVYYENKFLKSRTYKKNIETNEIAIAEFGTPASINWGILSRLASLIDVEKLLSDNAVIDVIKIGPHYHAVGGMPFLLQIDPKTLEIIQKINTNKLFGLTTQSVQICSDSDGHYTAGQSIGVTGPRYTIVKFPLNGDITKGQCVAHIPCRWRMCASYLHSIAITENYLVLIELPLTISLMKFISDAISNTPYIDGIHWRNENAIFHVLDRKTWKPVTTKYISNGFFFMHFANVCEYKDQLVITLSSFKNSYVIHCMSIDKLRNSPEKFSDKEYDAFTSRLVRYAIPLNVKPSSKGTELVDLPGSTASAELGYNEVILKPEFLSKWNLEHPVVNPKYSKAGARFIWGVGPAPDKAPYTYVIKIDVQTKQSKMFNETHLYATPPSFVPSPDAKDEDDGVILCLALSGKDEQLFTLLVLDASSLKEVARATTQIKTKVPQPLDGRFYSD